MDEVLQLPRQLVAGVAVQLAHLEVAAEQLGLERRRRAGVEPARIDAALTQMVRRLRQHHLPPGEIDADEAFRRPHLHPPHRRRVDAAGAEVGDAAVGEGKPRPREVLAAAQHGRPERLHRAHRRTHQRQNEIQIVDHQVEHDAHIGGATGEAAAALAADVLRL